MKAAFTILTAVVVLAIVRAAVVALILALLIVLLAAVVLRPRETATYLCSLVVIGLASAHPVPCIIIAGVVAMAVVIAGQSGKYRLRTDRREKDSGEPKRLDRDLLG